MIVSAIKAVEAASILGVELQDLDNATLMRAYRFKTKECHPDHHGNAKLEQWSRISWAKECLAYWVEQRRNDPPPPDIKGEDCRACEGTGRMKMRSTGFGKPLTTACVICRGVGTVLPQEDDGD